MIFDNKNNKNNFFLNRKKDKKDMKSIDISSLLSMTLPSTKFFLYPFGSVTSDITAVPDSIQVDGSVSYADGWGYNYQRDLLTDTLALPISRQQSNQLLYDVTTNLQLWQTVGYPNWILSSQNLGSPYPYSLYSTCIYDDGVNGSRVFSSMKNNNTDTPDTPASWQWFDGSANAITLQNGVIFDGSVVSGNIVYWNSISGTYNQALANGAAAQYSVGVADVTFGRIIQYGQTSSTYSLFTGLVPGATYYLSTSSPGLITAIMPNNNVVIIGVAVSATVMDLKMQQFGALSLGNSVNQFNVADATNPHNAVALDQFDSLFALTGYQKLPSGLIIQWGRSAPIGATNNVLVTFPISFPNSAFIINSTLFANGNSIPATVINAQPVSNSQMRLYCWGSVPASNGAFWLAIGY